MQHFSLNLVNFAGQATPSSFLPYFLRRLVISIIRGSKDQPARIFSVAYFDVYLYIYFYIIVKIYVCVSVVEMELK